jgi:hypothetical protein
MRDSDTWASVAAAFAAGHLERKGVSFPDSTPMLGLLAAGSGSGATTGLLSAFAYACGTRSVPGSTHVNGCACDGCVALRGEKPRPIQVGAEVCSSNDAQGFLLIFDRGSPRPQANAVGHAQALLNRFLAAVDAEVARNPSASARTFAARKLAEFRSRAAANRGAKGDQLDVDCRFGASTTLATQIFQASRLPFAPKEWDGKIGELTWTLLRHAPTVTQRAVAGTELPDLGLSSRSRSSSTSIGQAASQLPRLISGAPSIQYLKAPFLGCSVPTIGAGPVDITLGGLTVSFRQPRIFLPRAGTWEVGLIQNIDTYVLKVEYSKSTRQAFVGVPMWDALDGEKDRPPWTFRSNDNPRRLTVSAPGEARFPSVSYEDGPRAPSLQLVIAKHGTLRKVMTALAFKIALAVREVATGRLFTVAATLEPPLLVVTADITPGSLGQNQCALNAEFFGTRGPDRRVMSPSRELFQTTRPTANELTRVAIANKLAS